MAFFRKAIRYSSASAAASTPSSSTSSRNRICSSASDSTRWNPTRSGHQTMTLVSIAPVSIAAGDFHPPLELIGDTAAAVADRRRRGARRSRSPSSSRMDCRRCYSLPAAMGAKLALADRPVLCTMGEGRVFDGVGRIPFVTVVYNDNALSLIRVARGAVTSITASVMGRSISPRSPRRLAPGAVA